MAQQQQASLLLSKQGKVELGQRPVPSPQGKQALVKVTAAAGNVVYALHCVITLTHSHLVNPLDWKVSPLGNFITVFN